MSYRGLVVVSPPLGSSSPPSRSSPSPSSRLPPAAAAAAPFGHAAAAACRAVAGMDRPVRSRSRSPQRDAGSEAGARRHHQHRGDQRGGEGRAVAAGVDASVQDVDEPGDAERYCMRRAFRKFHGARAKRMAAGVAQRDDEGEVGAQRHLLAREGQAVAAARRGIPRKRRRRWRVSACEAPPGITLELWTSSQGFRPHPGRQMALSTPSRNSGPHPGHLDPMMMLGLWASRPHLGCGLLGFLSANCALGTGYSAALCSSGCPCH